MSRNGGCTAAIIACNPRNTKCASWVAQPLCFLVGLEVWHCTSCQESTMTNPAMTSFTPVHHEADWIFPGKILAWPTPFFALRSTHVLHHVVFCVYEGGRVGPSTVNGH